MGWERRGVAVAAATPVSVVVLHGAATLQAALVGPPISGAAAWLLAPVVAAGVTSWWRPSFANGVGTTLIVGSGLAAMGPLRWGFMPLVLLAGALCSVMAVRVARALPERMDGAWRRSRGKVIAWAALALVMVFQVCRLSAFMADRDNAWGSTFPFIEFTVSHMCMASYVHAADLTRRSDENVYAPEHYPAFDIVEGAQIDTSIIGITPYFDDAFLYPPPFLLLPRIWLGVSNDYLAVRSVWFAIQLLGFVAFAVFLARWIGGSSGALALWTLPLMLASMPTMFNFQFGQAHLLTVWASLAAMVAFEARRPAVGGLLLAWGITSKIFPGVLVLYLLFQKRWTEAAWTAGCTIVLALVTLAAVGLGPFTQFITYMLPKLESGTAFSFVTDVLTISTNLSIPGTVWKLPLLGIDVGRAALGTVSGIYTVLLLVAIWLGARRDVDRAGRVQIWLALLILASLRSPIVPIYGAAPILWLMTLELDRVDTRKGLAAFGLSWLFINGVPPAPSPAVTVALYGVAQIALLYWVLRPFRLAGPAHSRPA
jgi:hypothetical protein